MFFCEISYKILSTGQSIGCLVIAKSTQSSRNKRIITMNKFTKAGIVCAALTLVSQGAFAQTGNLILGFTGNSAVTDTTFGIGSLPTTSISTGTLSSGLSAFTSEGVFGNGGLQSSPIIDISVARTSSSLDNGLQGSTAPSTGSTAGTALNSAWSDINSITIGSGVASFTANSYSANTVAPNPPAITSTVYGQTGNNSSLVANGNAMDIYSLTEVPASGRNPATISIAYVGEFDVLNESGTATWEFDPAGVTPSAVPEPTTYGILAGAGLLALALRRKVSAKNA
jgi:hypothetical protein